MIRVGIAEDQKIFRQGLENLLNSFSGIKVVCTAENGLELVEQLETAHPDVVLVDYRMPVLNGLETVRKIRETNEGLRILILSMYDDPEFVETTLESGANGYLSKDDDPEEIEKAILSTVETGYYLNDKTSKILITKLMHQGKMSPKFDKDKIEFSAFEMEVLQLICREFTTLEIADKLCKSTRTIEGARTAMMQKVGSRNVVGLVMYAIKNNLISQSV